MLQIQDRGGDLDSRTKIHDLVVAFYRDVAIDDVLAPVFNEVAEVDWAEHLPTLVDYWCRVLLGERGYEGYILHPHQALHEMVPLRPEMFDRWIQLFDAALDERWAGPVADEAKRHAGKIASMLSRRITGRDWSREDSPRLSTPLTDRLGIDHPVLSAPMDGAAGGRLAAAVSAAGGFGFIGGGYPDPVWLRDQLDLAGDARVGVGFITFALDRAPAALDDALDAGVPAIQLSFGDPRPHADRIHDSGALLVCAVQSVDDVHQALEARADVLIAQGRDAGGHGRPDRGTMALIPSIVDRVAPLPVVAAGGIADGRGLAAALTLGASGVSLGTRFLATEEAVSSPAEARALVQSRSDDTVRSDVIDRIRGPEWPAGYDARILRNDLVDRWHDRPDEIEHHRDALRRAYRSASADDFSTRAIWAGESLDLVDDIETAGAVVRSTVARAVREIRSVASLVDSVVDSSADRSSAATTT
ncbi:MAG: nitronate monooxygenase [Acidimicrobiales bacterium]|nr:nitronate monooxygenase [Acidimicrobiales bacterium]